LLSISSTFGRIEDSDIGQLNTILKEKTCEVCDLQIGHHMAAGAKEEKI
jgi:hypothetical protein